MAEKLRVLHSSADALSQEAPPFARRPSAFDNPYFSRDLGQGSSFSVAFVGEVGFVMRIFEPGESGGIKFYDNVLGMIPWEKLEKQLQQCAQRIDSVDDAKREAVSLRESILMASEGEQLVAVSQTRASMTEPLTNHLGPKFFPQHKVSEEIRLRDALVCFMHNEDGKVLGIVPENELIMKKIIKPSDLQGGLNLNDLRRLIAEKNNEKEGLVPKVHCLADLNLLLEQVSMMGLSLQHHPLQ